ncbi:CarD family transcriptional regulator, partial [Evtepia sp.]|uniref:CarD family transcriptional regulator n=1 Tax=Evtepia sp. TaxID=2773933 RepID=UPI002A8DCFE2|nr:transcription-repair coupling factor [Evtepia sp.]
MPNNATSALTGFLARLGDYPRLLAALNQGKSPLALSGLAAVHRAHLAAALHKDTSRPLVVVCADEGEARRAAGDLAAFTGAEVPLLPARDFQFHPGAASRQWEHQRLAVFAALDQGDCPVLAATVEGLMQRTLPPDRFRAVCRTLSVGQVCNLDDLTDFLVSAGYTRCDQVEGAGQFSLRGGILDVFSPGLDLPVRMEFWGDEIDSMGLFDPVTQRRTAQRETCTLLPAGEVIGAETDPPDLSLPAVYDTLATAADYLPQNALVALFDTPRAADRAKHYLWQLGEDITSLLEQGLLSGPNAVFAKPLEQLCGALAPRPLLYLDSFATGNPPIPPAFLLSLTARQLTGYGVRFETLTEDLVSYQREDFSVVVLASTQRKADALQGMLREKKIYAAVDTLLHDLPDPGRITIAVGGLSAGFDCPEGKFAVLCEGEAPPPRKRPRRKSDSNRRRLESFTDLSPGDLVVHEHHGIGRFVGMVK